MGAVPTGSAAAVVLAYLREQADAVRTQEPLVRRDAEDAVHQMRVATRRARSALRTFGRVLERERTRALTDELRWLAGELAPARDAEVVHARLAELLAAVPEELVPRSLGAELDAVFACRGAHARARAVAALDSPRYRALLDALDALVADPPLARRGTRPARRVLDAEVARARRRLVAAVATALDVAPGTARDEALHEARKAAKRLRYAREAAGPALGKPAKRWRRRMAALQDLLGAHQDSVVMRATVLELAAGRLGRDGFALGLVHGDEALRAREVEAALPGVWARWPPAP
ncbi:CHAD domain-containing protein [Actinomycetospora sp. TBRC 11914]|uniref:CHAD domain-containing protein n=1 Tax=Actinomycetospora sp. TBRC 11914 TaxID=2729387 RepID=UPI00145C436A|nr:CHAD domain-containing protein [Actinomycetospora sp. TBRC 11914]NMO88478.1 CHAD domain-containing protein [Actinomycetospora sp. TBRC 11914]